MAFHSPLDWHIDFLFCMFFFFVFVNLLDYSLLGHMNTFVITVSHPGVTHGFSKLSTTFRCICQWGFPETPLLRALSPSTRHLMSRNSVCMTLFSMGSGWNLSSLSSVRLWPFLHGNCFWFLVLIKVISSNFCRLSMCTFCSVAEWKLILLLLLYDSVQCLLKAWTHVRLASWVLSSLTAGTAADQKQLFQSVLMGWTSVILNYSHLKYILAQVQL